MLERVGVRIDVLFSAPAPAMEVDVDCCFCARTELRGGDGIADPGRAGEGIAERAREGNAVFEGVDSRGRGASGAGDNMSAGVDVEEEECGGVWGWTVEDGRRGRAMWDAEISGGEWWRRRASAGVVEKARRRRRGTDEKPASDLTSLSLTASDSWNCG